VVTISLLIGEVRTGRITVTLDGGEVPTSLRWTDELNRAGSLDGVTIPSPVVAKYDLRQLTYGARCFMAVEVDGRIKVGGPIWGRAWDWEKGELTLSAAGLWSLLDKRKIEDDATYPSGLLTFSGVSLGGLAVSLVSHMLGHIPPYTNLPVVLPTVEPGDNEESFARWEILDYGEQLRQITQRAVDAPDIRFAPRRTAADPRFIEWVMQVGTEGQPSLTQGGPDWVFDTSAPRSSVLGISTDEDATQMAQKVWVTGNGSEADQKMASNSDLTLVDLGWPLTEVDESHPTVDDYDTLLGHADNLLARSNRPIEVFKVSVRAEAAREVSPGDYCQVIVKGDPWLGDMDRTMRVQKVSGDLSDTLTLDMFPLAATL
jgi:hypothetical protein